MQHISAQGRLRWARKSRLTPHRPSTSAKPKAFIALALLGLAASGAAWPRALEQVAAESSTHESAPAPPRSFAVQLPNRRNVTLAEAIMIAQRHQPGRVVRSQTLQGAGVHEVRIIGNDGTVHTLRIDARTGAVSESPTPF